MTDLPHPDNPGQTHFDGCWRHAGHHNCAVERADQLQATFDLSWKADMRAIKRWQADNPGNDLVWPDRADLVVYLLEKMDALQKAVERFEVDLKKTEAENALWRANARDKAEEADDAFLDYILISEKHIQELKLKILAKHRDMLDWQLTAETLAVEKLRLQLLQVTEGAV